MPIFFSHNTGRMFPKPADPNLFQPIIVVLSGFLDQNLAEVADRIISQTMFSMIGSTTAVVNSNHASLPGMYELKMS